MNYDLNDPAGRAAAAEALGPEGYNAAMQEHFRKNTIATVAGHDLRYVVSQRFGRLVMVGQTGKAFSSLADAEAFAKKNPVTP